MLQTDIVKILNFNSQFTFNLLLGRLQSSKPYLKTFAHSFLLFSPDPSSFSLPSGLVK